MAEEEEIIIIEEEDAAGVEATLEERYEEVEPTPISKKKIIIIGSAIALAFILILAFLLSDSDEKRPYTNNIEISEEQTQEDNIKSISSNELENMIKRANILYEKGLKVDALKLYERIATYSESISYYNLGVAQLQGKQYEKAISSFDLAIKSQKNMCVSAINAAVASLELGDTKAFHSYINLAHSYLPLEAGSPMYSYYYALINF
ncbi:MAG: hypothetical protein COA44_14870, partial [Arcobacter sp.]